MFDLLARPESDVHLVTIDLKVHPLESVLKTAYWFTKDCYLHIQFSEEDKLEVRLKPKVKTEAISGEFLNALLDQTLRDKLATQTEGLRNLIMAHALSKTCLVGKEYEEIDPISDPKQISKPDCAN